MFEEAGYLDLKGELSDELIDDLVIYGTQTEIARRLSKLTEGGISEVIAHAVLIGGLGQPEVFAMIAEANKLANSGAS